MRLAKHSITRGLAVLVAVLLAMPGLTTAAQPSATHQAGAATVTFGDTWKLQPDYSTSDNVFLMHDTLPATAFAYLETNEFGTTLVDAVLESFAMGFTSTFDPDACRRERGDARRDGVAPLCRHRLGHPGRDADHGEHQRPARYGGPVAADGAVGLVRHRAR